MNSEVAKLLSSMYLFKPTKETILSWKGILILLSESDNIPNYLLGLKNVIDSIDLTSDNELEELIREYTTLFIGPYKLPSPPWESVYTSPKRLMMQDAYDKVKEYYFELGLSIDDSNIMYDHIGAELYFISVLLKKIEECPDNKNYKEFAERFSANHLQNWIPNFTNDLECAAHSELYKELARTTNNMVNFLVPA